jgi:GPH family glycoside/pentoside/hexuronide:cation symporter
MLVYLGVGLMLFYTCFSFFSVPLYSLQYEMTPDYQERTRVSAFGAFFGKLGEILYQWIFWLAGLAIFGSVTHGMRVVGWIVAGVVMLGFGVLPGLLVRERYFKRAANQERVPFFPSIAASFQNRAFLVLVGLTICQIVAGMMTSSIDYYLIVYSMCDGDVHVGTEWKAKLSTAYAIIGIIGIYPVNWVANKFGKRRALVITFVLVLLGAVGKWVLYTPGNLWKIMLDPIFCGPVWIAINVLLPSMLADICDDDELRHGLRREGMFGSIFSWITKTGYSLSFFGTGWALTLSGFDASLGGAQHPGSIVAMRLILTIGTAIWAILALLLLSAYPLSRNRAYEIRDALEARRGTV